MKIAGYPNIASTQFHLGLGNVRMRVAMVLDNTGSMADDGKMRRCRRRQKPGRSAQRARQE